MQLTVLHLFQNKDLEQFCQEVLSDYDLRDFSPDAYKNAALVLTDSGIGVGEIPGFVPTLLFTNDEKPYPDSFYSRVLDEDLGREELIEEIEHSEKQAEIGKSMGMDDVRALNTDKLNELVAMGGEKIVKEGLRNFVKSSTLQLNECRSMYQRNSYDEIRFSMHRLKGNAATLGGEQLALLFNDMEESLKSENYSNFDEKLKLAYTALAAFNYLSNGWYGE